MNRRGRAGLTGDAKGTQGISLMNRRGRVGQLEKQTAPAKGECRCPRCGASLPDLMRRPKLPAVTPEEFARLPYGERLRLYKEALKEAGA